MRIGVVLPQTELGSDVGSVRAYAQAVESFGFRHILAFDHVLGVDADARPGWGTFYDVHSTFHEPLVLFGYLAGITTLELVTGILILPQRQTALVAKQAAEVDILSEGRLRLGVGIGWNKPEFEGLGTTFPDRGARMTEQIALMRALWTTGTVDFDGHYERVIGMGINPLPVQRPIPVWIGATAGGALRRAGQIADGWFPQKSPGAGFEQDYALVTEAAEEAGRDPSSIKVEGRVTYDDDLDSVCAAVDAWKAAGVAYVTVNTMRKGLATPDDHISSLGRLAEALPLSQ